MHPNLLHLFMHSAGELVQILGDDEKVITSVPVVISEGGTTDVQI